MQTPDTPQLTPIENAIDLLNANSNSVSNLTSEEVYSAVKTMLRSIVPYERQYLRDVAENAWDAAIATTCEFKVPNRETYLNQNHPL